MKIITAHRTVPLSQKGAADRVKWPKAPWYLEQAATVHTHAAYDPGFKNDVFSSPDKSNAKKDGFVAYLATPLGTLRRYNPKTEEDIPIDYNIPYDPNHL